MPLTLRIPRTEAEQKLKKRIGLANDLIQAVKEMSEYAFDSVLAGRCSNWNTHNLELLSTLFDGGQLVSEYTDIATGDWKYVSRDTDKRDSLLAELQSKRAFLEDSVHRLDWATEPAAVLPPSPPPPSEDEESRKEGLERKTPPPVNNKVFVVHGRDGGARTSTELFLKSLGLDPVLLHKKTNRGMTIIEKLEKHSDVGFAVVLLTGDDVGALESESDKLKPRARQNVVFELGYFVAKLGRDRVCPLYEPGVEYPNELSGVVFVELDPAEGWMRKLAEELNDAGFAIDMNKV